jgi:hypothetical protein
VQFILSLVSIYVDIYHIHVVDMVTKNVQGTACNLRSKTYPNDGF